MDFNPNRSMLAQCRILCTMLLGALLLSTTVTAHAQASRVAKRTKVTRHTESGFLPGVINIFSGNGVSDIGQYVDGSVPTQTAIGSPTAVATDSEGDVVFSNGPEVMMVYAGGTIPPILAEVTTQAVPSVTPLAGHIYLITPDTTDTSVISGETANKAPFSGIAGMWFDSSDNLYIADALYYSVFKVAHDTAIVQLVAGQFDTQAANSSGDIISGVPATSIALSDPTDVKTDAFGNIYIADGGNVIALVIYAGTQPPPVLAVEGIATSTSDVGNIYTIAGQVQNFCGSPGTCTDAGPANGSLISGVISIAVDAAGNVYILDNYAYAVRLIYAGGVAPPLLSSVSTPQSGYIYTIAGLNTQFTPCASAGCGDGGTAANVMLNSPLYLAVDTSGNVYIDDSLDFAIRKIDATGTVSTIAGIDDPNGAAPSVPAGGQASTSTALSFPTTIAFDPQSNLYIADAQYNIIWIAGPAHPQTITFPAIENPETYGVGQISLSATASSGLPVQYSSTGPGFVTGSGTTAELNITGAGTIAVTANQPGGTQYGAATPVTQSVTVDKANLIVTALEASKIQGKPNPTFVPSYGGFVSEDTTSALTGNPTITTTAVTGSPVGSYVLTVAEGSLAASNYAFLFVNGSFTITGSTPQTITFAQPSPIVYGQATTLALSGFASSGLPIQYSVVSGPGTVSGSTLSILGGGAIIISAEQAGNNTYAGATAVTRTLTVQPAPLTVTAPAIDYPFGTQINPALFPPPIFTGFVGSDGPSLVGGMAAYTTTATGTPLGGVYPLTVSVGSLAIVPAAAENYTLSIFVAGSITIGLSSQTISNLPLPVVVYNTLYTLTATSNSGLPVSAAVTGPVSFYPAGNNVTSPSTGNNTVQFYANGIGPATLTLTQAGSADFAPATPVVLSFNANPAPLNVQANNQIQEQGAQTPNFTYTIGANIQPGPLGGFLDIPSIVSGVPLLTTSATPNSPPGAYPIVPSVGTLVSPVYSFNFINGTLTVTPPGTYSVTATPSTLTIQSGMSAQSTVTITPNNAYQGTVTLTCGTLPTNVTCVISPATYNFPGSQNADGSENSAQGTITIETGPGALVGAARSNSSTIALAGLLSPAVFAGLWLSIVRRKARRIKSVWGTCLLIAGTLGLITFTSCGGSSRTTEVNASPGTSTIMITGSGTTPTGVGNVAATTPLTVIIQ